VAALVDHSLLRQEEGNDGETRFGMLETIRAYALERLAARGEMEAMQAQHAGYFGGVIVEQAGFGLYSPKALTWLNWLERELDNVRATLAWCLSTPQGVELAAGLVFSLIWFWYRRGYFIEGWLWTERVLNLPAMQAPSPPRATALSTSGLLALWKGEQKTALARMQESLEVELRGEDEFMVPAMLMGNGIAYINMGRDSDALPFLEQARAGFKAMGQAYFHVFTIVHTGNAQLGLGNPEQARTLHEEALAEAKAIGESWLVSFALNNLGEVARTQGKYELARGYYEQCEALLRDTGDRGDFARFEHSLGYIAQHEGDYTQAERQFRESLAMFRQLGNRRGMAECMAGLAGLKARQGEAEWGAAMLGAADTLLKVTGGAWWPADRVEVERTEVILCEALNEAALAAAREKGETMTLEEALAFASEIP
jgi:tetratricopeptide (TPR) repeat protein